MKNIFISTTVVIALIILTSLQYRWLTSWAERDITEIYRSIHFRVIRTLGSELEDELSHIIPLRKAKVYDIQVLNNLLSDKPVEYIRSIAITRRGKETLLFNGEEWTSHEGFKPLVPGKKDSYIVTIPGDDDTQLFLEIDIVGFFNNNKVFFNSILFPEYNLVWTSTIPEGGRVFMDNQYKYSPLGVIRDRVIHRYNNWYFTLGLNMEPRLNKGKLLFKPRPQSEAPLYYTVEVDGESLIRIKENFTTLQWGITFILLTGLGVAYILILNQVSKLKRLRDKERVFVASVTHELRTPLTVIHSAADNIEKGVVSSSRLIQYGELIKKQSDRLNKMVEDILLFSRLEGKAEVSPVLVRIVPEDIIKELEEIRRSMVSQYKRDIVIDFSFRQEFMSDFDSIILILRNLIENSCKHGDGKIIIRGHKKLPGTLIFSVEDSGKGINKKELKQIFQPFFRGKESYDNQIKGSGLGLFLANSKAKLLGGSLTLESNYERADGKRRDGVRATLTIPFFSEEGEDKK